MPDPIATPAVSDPKIAELEKKIEVLTKTVTDSQQFVEDSSVLISAIFQNPTLKEQVKTAINNYGNPNPPAPPVPPAPTDPKEFKFDPMTGKPVNAETPPVLPNNPAKEINPDDPRVNELDQNERERIVRVIEQKYGYTSLKEEDRKGLRQRVGKRLKAWGNDFFKIPVTQLAGSLEDAYLLEDLGKAKEENRIDALVEARTNDAAALPSMGGNPPTSSTPQLTAEQQKWTKKLDVPEDKVAARLKELTDTGVMTYKPPEPKDKPIVVTPSGNPAPPS